MSLIGALVADMAPPNQPNDLRRAVTGAELTALLDLARAAPSATNGQTWRFVVVTAPGTRTRLTDAVPAPLAGTLAAAPVVVVVCGIAERLSRRDFGIPSAAIDVPNALTHMVLGAAELGLPYAWTLDVAADRCSQVLGIPADVRVVGVVALG